jgi:hypothetical protein
MPINFDPNSLNSKFDNLFGAGAYNSGLSNAKKAAQLKTQAGFAKQNFLKAVSAYQAKQKKDQAYLDKYGMTYDQYQAKKQQDALNKQQDQQVLANGLTSDQAQKMRDKAASEGRGGSQPSYDEQRKEAQQSAKTSNDLTSYDTSKMTDHNKELVAQLQAQQLKAQNNTQSSSKNSSPRFLDELKNVGSKIGHGLMTAADIIDRPGDAVRTAIDEKLRGGSLLQGAKDGFTGKKNTDPVKFLRDLGVDPTKNKVVKTAESLLGREVINQLPLGRFAAPFVNNNIRGKVGEETAANSVAMPLDPLTYVGVGAGPKVGKGIENVAMKGLARFAKGDIPEFAGKPTQSIMDALNPKASASLESQLNNFKLAEQQGSKGNISNLPLNPSKGIENIKPFDGFQPKQPSQPRSDISNSPLLMSLNPAKTTAKFNPDALKVNAEPKLTPTEKQYQNEFQNAVQQQVQYLKNSMGKGVDHGTTSNGMPGNFKEVTGTYSVSNNPKWYQDFYKSTGRKPNNAELQQLATEHVLNGFQDELGNIPAYVPKKIQDINNQIDEAMNPMFTNSQNKQPVLKPYLDALSQEKHKQKMNTISC